MLLRLQKYSTQLEYHAGREMHLADALSRAYLRNDDRTGELSEETVHVTQLLPIPEDRLQEKRNETQRDKSLKELSHVIMTEWPDSVSEVKGIVQPYFNVRDERILQDGVIFRGDRVVIPESMRHDMLRKIHQSHIGTEDCLRRVQENLFWPRMNSETRDFISKCDICR